MFETISNTIGENEDLLIACLLVGMGGLVLPAFRGLSLAPADVDA